MTRLLPCAVALLVACSFWASPLAGQSGRTFVQLSSAVTWLDVADFFDAEPERHLAVSVGHRWRRDHLLELGVTVFELELTSREMIGFAHTRTELRATPVRITYQYEPAALRLGPLRPQGSVGAGFTRVVHRTQNDAGVEPQRTSIRSVDAALGLGVQVVPRITVLGRGGYRFSEEFPSPIQLSGPWADVGLRLFW